MELICKEELLKRFEFVTKANGTAICYEIKCAPTVEAVPKELYDQIKWERDIAISQLESYGVQFGEQADCVRVVYCKNCVFYDKDEDRDCGFYNKDGDRDCGLCTLINDGDKWFGNDFCSYGRRR